MEEFANDAFTANAGLFFQNNIKMELRSVQRTGLLLVAFAFACQCVAIALPHHPAPSTSVLTSTFEGILSAVNEQGFLLKMVKGILQEQLRFVSSFLPSSTTRVFGAHAAMPSPSSEDTRQEISAALDRVGEEGSDKPAVRR